MRIAVVGATGVVGRKMVEILEERNFPVTELIPVASEKSAGKSVVFKGENWRVRTLGEALECYPEIALFSAGSEVSKIWAPKFVAIGCKVIDNSSCWRMDPEIKLVVPEINAREISKEDMIIANPNCSTIQMVVALNLLHRRLKIERIVVSTYQSVTGTGQKGIEQLNNERSGNTGLEYRCAYKYQIDKNLIPQIDSFLGDGYTKEEMKMVNETHKILGDNTIGVSATTVRVPVEGGHSESVNVEFESEFEIDEIFKILAETPGVTLVDDPGNSLYPMPLDAYGKDDVFVGRIRRDYSVPNGINLWIVADNLRRGAATNAVQIAEHLLSVR
ncbi:MAG: aspartate-semialdehyde dehydrogenase [Bacteroidales bacterium]